MELWTALIGVAAGAFGYWFATFSVQPILKYGSVRSKVLMDFTYYAQVVNADGLTDDMQALFRERVLENRRSSAQLQAAVEELPFWYLWFLRFGRHNPSRAANRLIGYSNERDWQRAHDIENSIRQDLGLPAHDQERRLTSS